MKTLETLRQQLARGEFAFSHHAFKRVVERNISAEADLVKIITLYEPDQNEWRNFSQRR
jgi:hypothetical protein